MPSAPRATGIGQVHYRDRRPELNPLKIERRRAARELRRRQSEQGLTRPPTATLSNGQCPWKTVEEEKEVRQQAVAEQIRVFRSVLPTLLKRLARIRDPRNPKTVQHQFTVVLL